MDAVNSPPPYAPGTAPISSQPVSDIAHLKMQPDSNHEALFPLIAIDRIKFKQSVEWLQIVCGIEMPIRFELANQLNTLIYLLREDENCCERNCIPQGFRTRSTLLTANGAVALKFQREGRCVLNCCMPCCCYPLPFSRERLTVLGPNGAVLGVVQQEWSWWTSRFTILNAEESVVLKINGPSLNFACFTDVNYEIVAPNDARIGNITKHYAGFVCDTFADFDDFTINFPGDLDVAVKATLLGAVSLINLLFFQGSIRRLACGLSAGICRAGIDSLGLK
ncbi:phospholipid scramblase 2-like [Wyeomyia smithii]|uniref:phospholipid scramblase 2-like n=1 Tax=Wyeomyia smithii TaxID=174621 RepID=UPI002467CE52|nr:phospholipid scramblase 2-like [Wyeomyia smithii]